MNPKSQFHPAVAAWFAGAFSAPTPAQAEAWPAIAAGRNVLLAAPTGSGKTLAAFLAAIDDLVRQGLDGRLEDATQVVYVSPLKALSNDIQKNLEVPLAGIRAALNAQGLPDVEIRTWVRTGDTPAAERTRAQRRPPHIVVTTPESLYILLGSESGRKMLATTRTVIVDEIHALAPNKRGTHLALSLERLEVLCGRTLLRIGLSATQKPIEAIAQFLVGAGAGDKRPACKIIDTGHRRARDLALEVPDSPLEAVMSAEVWEQVYGRLAALIEDHRTTLIFVNTRRMAERVTRQLSLRLGHPPLQGEGRPSERSEDGRGGVTGGHPHPTPSSISLRSMRADPPPSGEGEDAPIAAHHGSLAKEARLDAEQRLKRGKLKVLVATASLELGIDIGEVDLVCQLGSPHGIASFLQRVGRSGHAVAGTPKGRLFPLSRDDLVECAALIDSVRRGELDALTIRQAPLDVLAQHIVAEAAARDWDEEALYALVRRAMPYRALARGDFAAVVAMLAEGFSTRRGRRGALIHYDSVNHVLRGRRGARLTALTSGGTIPENADYAVHLEPDNHVIGSVNEDFAVESMAGDIFQLGNRSYRIRRVERGVVRVEDAHGMAPTIPFWLGEAPGRSDELSDAVSRLRAEIAARLQRDPDRDATVMWLVENGVAAPAAQQLVEYLAAAHAALGTLPTRDTIVLERFFDETGGAQLVIHSPYGSRINRAWGLALRKRFCRKFNFELQAAATEDNIVISLTHAHSFALDEVIGYLNSASIRQVLIQAMLDAPMFITRWRWVIGVALAQPRFRGGRKVPPQLARMGAEDLIGAVFPDQIACAENLAGEREVPDHPLVRQTIDDCLGEAMDLDGLTRVLKRIEAGDIQVVARDLTEPSPLALEVLSARPYAFLDDAPLEERRTQAVMSRRWLSPEDAADIGRLDADAIARVRAEAWPEATNADELHDALVWLGLLSEAEAGSAEWSAWLTQLAAARRVTRLRTPTTTLWVTAERLTQFQALCPDAALDPPIAPAGADADRVWSADEALIEIVRGRLEGLAVVTPDALARPLGLGAEKLAMPLAALEVEGFAMRGRFTPGATTDEWCERRLLARINSYTVKRLRAEIEPVSARDLVRFLLSWQRVTPDARMKGAAALDAVVGQLEGFEAPAAAWESEILPARLAGYLPAWLDARCLAGHITWTRLKPRNGQAPSGKAAQKAAPVRTTPITLLARRHSALWGALAPAANGGELSHPAQRVREFIAQNGASFFDELAEGSGLLRTQVEEALAELVARGLVTSDSFAGLRALLVPSSERKPYGGGKRRHRTSRVGMDDAGRWALVRRAALDGNARAEATEHIARTLLRRYGVVFWRLIEREADWLPPWRDLLRVFRRLESRGEVRGGRFVAGFAGEQFALPDAVGLLRETRRRPVAGALVSISGADPLNLVGILTPGPRLAALTGNRLLYEDGLPIALLVGGQVQFLQTLDPAREWEAHKALLLAAEAGPSIVPRVSTSSPTGSRMVDLVGKLEWDSSFDYKAERTRD